MVSFVLLSTRWQRGTSSDALYVTGLSGLSTVVMHHSNGRFMQHVLKGLYFRGKWFVSQIITGSAALLKRTEVFPALDADAVLLSQSTRHFQGS